MKIRGWLLVGAVVLSARCAMAATTDPEEVGYWEDAPGNIAEQQVIIKDILGTAVSADILQSQLITSSAGTLVPALGTIATGGGTAEVRAGVGNLVDAIVAGDTGSVSILSGTSATAASDAAGATTSAIGGGGGVIAGRQSSLMAERKSLGNVDSALASFRMNQNLANRIWASPFYTRQEMGELEGYSGYDYSAWGASLGYDRAFGSFFAGASFTYSRGDFDADNLADDNTIDNYGFSLYGQYYGSLSGIFATVSGGYNYGDNDMRAATAAGAVASQNETDSYWFGANVGKDFSFGENWTLTPSVGLFWAASDGTAYTSTLNGAAFQNFDELSSESLLMPFDLKVEYTAQVDADSTVSFNVSGGYAYNWKEDGGRSSGSFNYAGTNDTVFLQGVKPGKNNWNIGAGVTYRRNNFDIGLNYRYDAKKEFDGHRIAATVGWNF